MENLTLRSLIATLQDYERKHGDLPVAFTWEGIYRDPVRESVFLAKDGERLLIDADGCNYRDAQRHESEPPTRPKWWDSE